MTDINKQFGLIIGNILLNRSLPPMDFQWEGLVPLFEKHNLIPILYDFLSSEETNDLYLNVRKKALNLLSVHINQQHEISRLIKIFEENQIDVIFLKGSVTCKRYPKEEYRTMGDIDILYQVDKHKKIKQVLFSEGYIDYKEGRKNDTFKNKNKTPIETHRQLVPSDSLFFSSDWCKHVWERSKLNKNSSHIYHMTIEDEIIFNIIHFAIHFLEGGAGARFLCDVLIYIQQPCDWQYVNKILRDLKLLDFYKTMIEVADYWFVSSKKDNELYNRVIDYIMDGGVFGNYQNILALKVEDGRLKYLKSTIFPSYNEMCSLYPWLKGKFYFLPIAWGKRGINTIIHKKGEALRTLYLSNKFDKKKIKSIRRLYNECGLNIKLRQ